VTLYKHGVGFFERRAELSGEEVALAFRVEEMNDLLKSLTVIDRGGGQVLGVDYATPQSREERLAGCSIHLGYNRSLRDLLFSLRGRQVRLLLDQDEELLGSLVGLDEVGKRHPLAESLVSLLVEETAQVRTLGLTRVRGVEILDERGARDLEFFLESSLSEENFRQVTIRLSPGEHDLSVSYIAPAPTWRVSYRLVFDPTDGDDAPSALLQGWGIFDNRLEEDLEGISLSLVAGMPISFVYDLYRPFTPRRPVVEEEARVAPGPVAFGAAVESAAEELLEESAFLEEPVAPASTPMPSLGREEMESAFRAAARGKSLGELFQYVIDTPVTVSRGRSAMVPIVSADMGFSKNFLYNRSKMPDHPVATLRMTNGTGLILERGPVTVIEGGEYVGEAVLPFTAEGGEVVVPYAVELGVKVSEDYEVNQESKELRLEGAFLLFEEWVLTRREYRVNNRTQLDQKILIEHPRSSAHELYDTPKPIEKTDEVYRFEVKVGSRDETVLEVRERRLMTRKEELHKQNYRGLKEYLEQGLLDKAAYDKAAYLLGLWDKIADSEGRIGKLDKKREKVYKSQQQVHANMKALSKDGKEGTLRAKYVAQLETSEGELRSIEEQESKIKKEIEQLNQGLRKSLAELEQQR
jgi:hypothetical protein